MLVGSDYYFQIIHNQIIVNIGHVEKIKIRTKETFSSWVTLKPQRTGSFHERTDGLMVISLFHPKKKEKKEPEG